MESEAKLKEKLPHKAIKEIARIVGVSSFVVSKVVNGKVMVTRRDGTVVRACSEDTELRIIATAVKVIKEWEIVCGRNAEQKRQLIASLS